MAEEIRNIKSIQVFNTISEVLSVTRAAEVLSISQSSVSYHIKKLETAIGLTLFRRTSRGLELTEEGTLLAVHVERGLGDIQSGLAIVKARVAARAGSVKIALLPMFSSRWLSPRLGHLLEKHPDMQLSIQNHNNRYAYMENPAGFADVGIQWGRGDWQNFNVTPLWPEQLVAVCSPDYLKTHPVNQPADLVNCKLLHVDDTLMWEEWLLKHGQQLPAAHLQMMLEDRHFQLSSTVNGLGVSLFASRLIQNEIQNGELVSLFEDEIETSFAYHLIVPKGNELLPAVKQFTDWLLKTSQQSF